MRKDVLVQADVLEFLARLESKGAALVYLDPPWPTASLPAYGLGKRLSADEQEATNKFQAYLDWLGSVLLQSKRVCSARGTVVLHVPPPLGSYARVMANRLFGADSVSEIIVAKPGVASRQFVSERHESLLFCRLSLETIYHEVCRPLTSSEMQERFPHKDARGRFGVRDMTGPFREGLSYAVNGVLPPEGRSWRVTEAKFNALNSENRIYFSPQTQRPFMKVYESEFPGVPVGTTWYDLPRGLFGEATGYIGQQSLALLERVIAMTTSEGDLVVDPFVGAGSSPVAAISLNRHWIGSDNAIEAIKISRERLAQVLPSLPDVLQVSDFGDVVAVNQHNGQLSNGLVEPERGYVFTLNEPVSVEESRHYEFKEVKGDNPVRAIREAADEYAVAYLNSEGGPIFWGIRDSGRLAIGVRLDSTGKDDVAKAIDGQLANIQPSISPSYWRIHFHPVLDHGGLPVADLFVVELVVPYPDTPTTLYATGSGSVFVKSDSGKKKLNHVELMGEVRRRSAL